MVPRNPNSYANGWLKIRAAEGEYQIFEEKEDDDEEEEEQDLEFCEADEGKDEINSPG